LNLSNIIRTSKTPHARAIKNAAGHASLSYIHQPLSLNLPFVLNFGARTPSPGHGCLSYANLLRRYPSPSSTPCYNSESPWSPKPRITGDCSALRTVKLLTMLPQSSTCEHGDLRPPRRSHTRLRQQYLGSTIRQWDNFDHPNFDIKATDTIRNPTFRPNPRSIRNQEGGLLAISDSLSGVGHFAPCTAHQLFNAPNVSLNAPNVSPSRVSGFSILKSLKIHWAFRASIHQR
jgi:hypothetical protein